MRQAPLLLALGLTGALSVALPGTAAADCAGSREDVAVGSFTRVFSSGAVWSFDISHQDCEGMVMQNLVYTPAGGSALRVLTRGSISSFHVPYDDNVQRFEDVTRSTDGFGSDAHILDPGECAGTAPGGGPTLFDGNRICVRNVDGGIRWKNGNTARRAERVQAFMASAASGYDYINLWELNDDGSISVRTGLTGALVETVNKLAYLPGYGARIDNESNATPLVAVAHQHNVYYRLDFDLGGAGNDRVLKKTFTTSTASSPDGSCGTAGQCGKISYSAITSETSQTWSSSNFTSWVVTDKTLKNADGRNIGYELVPTISGIWRGRTGLDEPWAGHELYVTAFRDCEEYAANNSESYLPDRCFNTGAPADVTKMINGESVDGADVVVWYANRFHHYPRDEDDTRMPVEWMSFDLVPRSFFFQNPSP